MIPMPDAAGSQNSPDQAQASVSIISASPAQFCQRIDELVDIHLAAMSYSPTLFQQRKSLWLSNTNHLGFQCHIALIHNSDAQPNLDDMRQRSAGVCFSFRGTADTWWYQQVYRGLILSGHSRDEAHSKLSDYSELSEVHVSPHLQGHGIGKALMTAHLRELNTSTVMLSTPEVDGENNGAWRLYRKLGFTDVLRDFRFPSDDRPFAILERATETKA